MVFPTNVDISVSHTKKNIRHVTVVVTLLSIPQQKSVDIPYDIFKLV